MDRTEIRERVINLLKKFTRKKGAWETANDETNFADDLKINSARFIDIVLAVEDEFNIEVEDAILETMLTIGDVVRLVESKQEG